MRMAEAVYQGRPRYNTVTLRAASRNEHNQLEYYSMTKKAWVCQ